MFSPPEPNDEVKGPPFPFTCLQPGAKRIFPCLGRGPEEQKVPIIQTQVHNYTQSCKAKCVQEGFSPLLCAITNKAPSQSGSLAICGLTSPHRDPATLPPRVDGGRGGFTMEGKSSLHDRFPCFSCEVSRYGSSSSTGALVSSSPKG